jgi:acetyl esterase/lipase
MQPDLLARPVPSPGIRIAYGADPNQFGELRVPREYGPHPAVLLIHGGFWRSETGLDYMGHAAFSLFMEGVATFSIEYRRLGNAGGGWPGTFDDIRAAARHLASNSADWKLKPSAVAVAGHGSGAQLALWLAAENVIPLRGAVSVGGVADLRRAHELNLAGGAVAAFLGGPPQKVPDRYKAASPLERIPLRCPVRLIHGAADPVVPIELARRYESAAKAASADARLTPVPNCGHFELVDPRAAQWPITRSALRGLIL